MSRDNGQEGGEEIALRKSSADLIKRQKAAITRLSKGFDDEDAVLEWKREVVNAHAGDLNAGLRHVLFDDMAHRVLLPYFLGERKKHDVDLGQRFRKRLQLSLMSSFSTPLKAITFADNPSDSNAGKGPSVGGHRSLADKVKG